MEYALKDFWIISKPLKTIYENANKFCDGKYDSNQIKIFDAIDNRSFGLSVISGIFFEMSELAVNELKKKEKDSAYEINKEIDKQLQIMAHAGIFSSNVIKTEYKYISKMNMNLCHMCNLRCKYCFAEGGAYGQQQSYMSRGVAQKSIDLFLKQLPESADANIILFGGEPLINLKLLKWIIYYAQAEALKKNIKITYDIFTNGTLLNDEIKSLMEEMPNLRILLSMDGPAEINDYFRGCSMKESVTGIIERNLEYIKPFMEKRVVVRCTIGWKERDLLKRIQYFSKMGFKNIVIDPAYCIDVKGIDHTEEIIHSIIDQLPQVAKYLGIQIKAGNKMNVNLISEMIAQILKNGVGEVNYEVPQCPGGQCYVAIDSTGEIYPCHYFVGKKDYMSGSVYDNCLTRKNMITDNGKKNLEKNIDEICNICDISILCEGSCPYKRLQIFPENYRVHKAHCKYMNRRIEEALRVLCSFFEKEQFPYLIIWNTLLKCKEDKVMK